VKMTSTKAAYSRRKGDRKLWTNSHAEEMSVSFARGAHVRLL